MVRDYPGRNASAGCRRVSRAARRFDVARRRGVAPAGRLARLDDRTASYEPAWRLDLSGLNQLSRLFSMARIGVLLLLVGAAGGCVQRQLTIRTNPPGAFVYIDDYPIGVTPCSTPYTYYGTRKLKIVKDGYETLTTYQKISTPWYQYPGLDFVSENLWPAEIRDDRQLSFQLEPQKVVPPGEIIARGENLRMGARAIGPLPPGAVIGPDGRPMLPDCAPTMSPSECLNDQEPPRMAPFYE